MFASSLGGVERLENGNTLVTWGVRGTLFEVNPEGEVVWKYINPVIGDGPLNQGDDIPENPNGKSNENKVFKTNRYNSSFPAFVGKDMTPGDYVESWTDDCSNEESIPWDSDGDGCIDDSDGDGVKDNVDLCSGFDDNIDIDGDSIPDDCDSLIDSDADGVADSSDACPGYDDSVDVDADGIPDGCDSLIDSDADGVADSSDACPGYDDAVDVDADGIPDGCDSLIDSDGDGVSDTNDVCLGHNDSIDIDQDGIADGCDSLIDSDADGISDADDQCAGYNDLLDQDGDGIPDNCDQTPMPEDDQTNVTDTTPVDDDDPPIDDDDDEDSSGIESETPQKSGIVENLSMVNIALGVVLILLLSVFVLLQLRSRE